MFCIIYVLDVFTLYILFSVYYEGNFDAHLIELVYNNQNGDLDEGIIFKTKKAVCKIKTKQWLDKIKTLDNWEELV